MTSELVSWTVAVFVDDDLGTHLAARLVPYILPELPGGQEERHVREGCRGAQIFKEFGVAKVFATTESCSLVVTNALQ